jgi:predicted aldo/keto reductase-like oxidoreductase
MVSAWDSAACGCILQAAISRIDEERGAEILHFAIDKGVTTLTRYPYHGSSFPWPGRANHCGRALSCGWREK